MTLYETIQNAVDGYLDENPDTSLEELIGSLERFKVAIIVANEDEDDDEEVED
jgi:hypothetical protein